jgi:acetyltransferase-like isoleucine patch superfamily enzyme
MVKANADFLIGNNVGISNSTFVCCKNIIIEDDVLIGGSCRFYDTDFHSLDYVSRTNAYKNGIPDDNIESAPILIKKGAWIGGICLILKGVTIGTKSVIGAGSIVSKDIPDNEIWAGNPVKFIRKL